jgi:spermidine/putrescine transport system ATP-binding protein
LEITVKEAGKLKGSEIRVENVTKRFGDFVAVENASFEIQRGEFFSLLGPSGCGKTTLLRIIAGFEDPSEGIIYLDGQNLIKILPNERPVNIIFQNYALFPHLSVFENVAFSLRLLKISESEIKRQVEKYLSLVKLDMHTKKYPSQLSGGQKQRVAIARALIGEPKVLLLDEPLSALDAKLRQHMLIELDSIHDEVGITFIYVTHDQQEALSVSDRVAIMNDGEVLQIGTPHQIYESPADSFVASFLGETNFLRGRVNQVNEEYAKIEIKELGELFVYLDKPLKINDVVKLTIRPEKIRITKQMPENLPDKFNVLHGRVDEVIYSGFQSKYFVKSGKFSFKVYKQHVNYLLDETPIKWNEDVFIWWNVDDGFIVEVEEE